MRFLTEFFGIFGIFCFKFGFGALNSSLRAFARMRSNPLRDKVAFLSVNSQNGCKFMLKKRTACVMDCRANPCGFARNDGLFAPFAFALNFQKFSEFLSQNTKNLTNLQNFQPKTPENLSKFIKFSTPQNLSISSKAAL